LRASRSGSLLVAALLIAAPPAVGAQDTRRVDPSAAELAIATGRLDVAEAALYDAVSRSPREPAARGALGAFLAARGKFLAGATLLDEAMQFGADTATIEARELEVYRWTGEFGRIPDLRTARMPEPQRAAFRRAARAATGGAAADTVPLAPNEALGLGRIVLTVRGARADADVDVGGNGVTLPSSAAMIRAIEAAGARGDTTFGVATVDIGRVRIGPIPVRLVPGIGVAKIGLDVLSLLTPTFDRDARRLVVHAAPYAAPGARLPLLLTFPGVTFVAREGTAPVALDTPAGHAALRGTRWTLDVAAGAIVVGTP
jgi:hypothetical protein